MPATIAAARAGVDDRRVGADAARGVRRVPRAHGRGRGGRGARRDELAELREEVERVSEALGRRLKILVGKPGLDGHSNGAEQIAVRARDAGMDVVYEGIRLTPAQIAASAAAGGRPRRRPVDPLGLAPRADPGGARGAARRRASEVPVVVGGIIPEADAVCAPGGGRRRGLHPKDWDLSRMMRDIVALVAERNGIDAPAAAEPPSRARRRRARRPPARAGHDRRARGT